jgi:hypothetical protein
MHIISFKGDYVVHLRGVIVSSIFLILVFVFLFEVFALLELLVTNLHILFVIIHELPSVIDDLSLDHLCFALPHNVLVLESELCWRVLGHASLHILLGCREFT